MALDPQTMQSLLQMFGGGGATPGGQIAPIINTQAGGPMGPGGGAPQMQQMPQMAPGSMRGMAGAQAPGGTPQGLLGGPGPLGLSNLGLMQGGLGMMQASAPGQPGGLGSILGAGLGGYLQGAQMSDADALKQQQAASLQAIGQRLGGGPGGGMPPAVPGAGGIGGMPQTGAPGQPPVMAPGTPGGPSTQPQVPGMAAIRPDQVRGGNVPMAPGGGPGAGNPFLRQMMQRRMLAGRGGRPGVA